MSSPTPSLPVRNYMAPIPQTIGVEENLASAESRMTELACHHLPVLRDRDLVGVLTTSDLNLARALGVNLEDVAVGIGMTAGPYVVGPDEPLPQVARTLARRRVGCAVVVEDGNTLGILTVGDALLRLADLVTYRFSPDATEPPPSLVRQRILREHAVLSHQMNDVGALANLLLEEDAEVETQLRDASKTLYQMLMHHMDLEDKVLAPALRQTPTVGNRVADSLVHKHEVQRQQLNMVRVVTEDGAPQQLAQEMLNLIRSVRADIAQEEKELLSPAQLHDDLVEADFTGG